MDDNINELLALFFIEADEQLQRLDEGILALDRDADDLEPIDGIFRAAHTLKGSAASVGLDQVASIAHSMENLLDRIRSGEIQGGREVTDALLSAVDALRSALAYARTGDTSDCMSVKQVLDTMARVSGSNTHAARSQEMFIIEARISEDCAIPQARAFMIFRALNGKGTVIDSSPSEDCLDQLGPGSTLTIRFQSSTPPNELVSCLEGICEVDSSLRRDLPPSTKETAKAEEGDSPREPIVQTVRVGVERLDRLVNLVGELVIDRRRIEELEGELFLRYESDALAESLTQEFGKLGRIVSELHEEIMRIRMLPVGQVFNRFPRMIRDLARKEGKKVDLEISGSETELDRSVLEEIIDPLTHMLRNSVCHGIESPEERLAAEKSEIGLVNLSARQEHGEIVIEVRDDGRGIPAEDVRHNAIARGIIAQEAAERLTEKECVQLIMRAGVSTAEQVNDVSGRGVGMDVVKRNIEGLSGGIDIETQLGAGTKITLRLPLTLAILRALVASANGQLFAIPHVSITETGRYSAEEIKSVRGRAVLPFRGSVLRLVNLSSILEGQSDCGNLGNQPIIIVVSSARDQIGLVVDEIMGEQEVAIKPLGAYVGRVDGISGATLLGDGRIALIVDVIGLQAMVSQEADRIAA